MPLNDPYPGFKVTLFFDAEYLRNGIIYRHSFNGILIGTYIRALLNSVVWCDLAWPWVTAKYSMARNVARSLCDSWASCKLTLSKKSQLVTVNAVSMSLELKKNTAIVNTYGAPVKATWIRQNTIRSAIAVSFQLCYETLDCSQRAQTDQGV